jgi:uncharacterized protein YyaL (SSP411 family)
MANALAAETSPYLRQHRDNPVDWLPWGERALARARDEDRPLLVSIGYSSCHWCHVMERESFEDERTAELMNRHFVCVKVDREERPDIDAIYMEAVQAMTGQGGWPLNVFLTPEQVPFHGGTYFPPEPRHGMPAWPQVLEAVAKAWEERREEIRAGGARLRERLSGAALLTPSPDPIDPALLDTAVQNLAGAYDALHGGFGGAPKFPASSVIEFLLARAATRPHGADGAEAGMALHNLRAMARGGLHDQVGGGFHRYSVDAAWTVPHFEKMLYDNALLARAHLHGWLFSGDEELLEAARGTLDWALREMRGPEGAFFSALDADSEGVEGRFYVWTVAELEDALGDDADAAIAWLGATEEGNFSEEGPGANVLQAHGPRPPLQQRTRIRQRLLEARSARTRPALDDKRLTAWNALMIGALADAGAALPARGLDGTRYLQAAREAADFVLAHLRDARGRLLRTYNDGQARLDAYLEDHAFLLEALLDLYQATFDERWFSEARALADAIIARFGDPERGGFFSTADDHERLLARRKDLEDAPIPSGASSAALGMLRLSALSGEARYEDAALGVLRLLAEIAPRHPTAFGHLLQAIDLYVSPVREVALAGEDLGELAAVVRSQLRPHVVLAGGPGGDDSEVPLMVGRMALDGRAAAYVCERFSCLRPVTEPRELQGLLT